MNLEPLVNVECGKRENTEIIHVEVPVCVGSPIVSGQQLFAVPFVGMR